MFPLDCPRCVSSSGYPYEARTVQGRVTAVRIALRCRQCRHEWELYLDTEPLPLVKAVKAERVAMEEVKQNLVPWDLPEFKAVVDLR